MRPHGVSSPFIPSIPIHLHSLPIQIPINRTPRNLVLRIIPPSHLLNHNRIRLHIKNHNRRHRTRRPREPVIIPSTRRTARTVNLGDGTIEIGREDFEDVEFATTSWGTGTATVAAVLGGVEDLGVESPDGGRFRLVGGGFGGHVEGEDESFGTGPAVVGGTTGETVAGNALAASTACNIDFVITCEVERERLGIRRRYCITERTRRVRQTIAATNGPFPTSTTTLIIQENQIIRLPIIRIRANLIPSSPARIHRLIDSNIMQTQRSTENHTKLLIERSKRTRHGFSLLRAGWIDTACGECTRDHVGDLLVGPGCTDVRVFDTAESSGGRSWDDVECTSGRCDRGATTGSGIGFGECGEGDYGGNEGFGIGHRGHLGLRKDRLNYWKDMGGWLVDSVYLE